MLFSGDGKLLAGNPSLPGLLAASIVVLVALDVESSQPLVGLQEGILLTSSKSMELVTTMY